MAGKILMPDLSCLPVSLYPKFKSGNMTVARWTAMAKQLGLDAIDLSVLITRDDKTKPAFSVDSVAAYTDFTHPDEAVRESEFSRFMEDLCDCAAIGAKYLRVTAGQSHPQITIKQGLNWAEKYLRRAAEFAQVHDVGLLFENHSRPGVWQYYDFAGEPEIYFELVERIRDTNIDLLFDTANACFYKQNPVRMLSEIFPKVRRIHVADIVMAETLKPVLIGKGIVPLSDIFCFLKNNNFSGALSIEEASFSGFDGIKKAVDATRNLWNDA
ncbi:MAG: Xylose isomerase domain-containing protein TIM barrel [Candidatus Uhrbacteria bacterium GW2011_GWF2_39_13]|uniref:Xylose isomerase domain-containing protein TIM barrel n=1 Tax=Candidatus Uhrbacteria bacterium GW2011_GWF2_39_13 TaxID=1618995 RepID=A0A0G0MKK1_9BACT|nr:MAG: Xylose isomerase domain-containing protein TIM barrel [Candidatus Uhrbacteria bacterium GW2011_GWF2_39_13]